MENLISTFLGSFDMNFNLIKINIDNATDEVWEDKCGGDFYWEQIYHSLLSILHMLPIDEKTYNLPIKNAGMMDGSKTDDDHSKEVMLKMLDTCKSHVHEYMKYIEEKDLFEEIETMGMRMTRSAFIILAISHQMYHIGVCDASLREHDLKSAI